MDDVRFSTSSTSSHPKQLATQRACITKIVGQLSGPCEDILVRCLAVGLGKGYECTIVPAFGSFKKDPTVRGSRDQQQGI